MLADELVDLNIVESISYRTVQRTLKKTSLRWMNTRCNITKGVNIMIEHDRRAKFRTFTLATASLLSSLLLISPLSTQMSNSFLSLDLDGSEGDQAVSFLNVLPNRVVTIQIFGNDLEGMGRNDSQESASEISVRFEYDPAQVVYEKFDAGDVLPNAVAAVEWKEATVQIKVSSWVSGATVKSGLVGTIRFRTTREFSETEIRLVHAELRRGEQSETASLALSVALQVPAAPSPDLNGNGAVDFPDFILFANAFGSRAGQARYETKYDLDINHEIGFSDFLIFVANFGKVVNRVPVFTVASDGTSVTLSVAENTQPGQPIGDPISATDADGNALTYSLSGADADSFAIEANTGQIKTQGTYDFEQKSGYSVIVRVSDSEGGRAIRVAVITINNLDEVPGKADAPTVTAVSPTSLEVTWTAPENAGPDIIDYDLQYRAGSDGGFTDANYDGTELRATLTGLSGTRYEIQVRAKSDEGTGPWSDSGTTSDWRPVAHDDYFEVTILGTPGGVNVAVVDGEGFSEDTHGQRITNIFLANTNNALLVQIDGWGSYRLNGRTLYASVMVGYIKHALEHDGGIFWTATDDSPLYSPQTAGQWFVENDRAFLRNAREFASWMQHQNTLYIKALENSSVVSADLPRVPAYCDDFDGEFGWIPLCGSVSDYVAHSGVGTENTIFVGAIKTDSGDLATGAIRADGVFTPHTIYVESPDGSTSQATPVLAAYATNLAFGNPTWGAARLKQELMKLSREEVIDYDTGATDSQGAIMPERRTIKAIRPAFAP